jgi:hypothetical protein
MSNDSPSNNNRKSKSKRAKPKRIEDYPRELQGPPQNRHGGHQTQRLRGFRGTKYGASPGRRFTKEEIAEYERHAREKGQL